MAAQELVAAISYNQTDCDRNPDEPDTLIVFRKGFCLLLMIIGKTDSGVDEAHKKDAGQLPRTQCNQTMMIIITILSPYYGP